MSATEHPQQPAKRSKAPLILLAVLLIAAVGVGVYHFTVGRFHVATDDAYVNGNLVRLTPQVSGTVVAIGADQTQFVNQGQLLVQLDPRDSEVALAQAKATLGQTVRQVAQLFANEKRDEAVVAQQQTLLAQASQDLARDRSLVAVHGVSAETIEHDQHAERSARANLDQAQATLAASRAATANTTPETHPQVLQAEASLRNAWLAAARTKVVAPVSGYIVRRSVQLGQQVTPGSEMLAIIPVDSMWIDANFKENQLAGLRIGQPVDVSADMYGSHAEYHGKVLGLTAGTGSALAVLPAQNATGNWIKVVQRLPVRIRLDPKELAEHPLRIGLSMHATIDVHDSGSSSGPAAEPSASRTSIYDQQASAADALVDKIISDNRQ